MTQNPLILVIDDSPTIRKMVECHLSQAGYRVAMAVDAERGIEMAGTIHPDLILLDHQLPGTTGDVVCRHLLASEATAKIPVLVSSAMRHRAFAQYSDFPNVIDQIPKPFTPELLKSGVANALETGALVVQAQRTGCAMPEAIGDSSESTLSGRTDAFSFRSIIDFLNNSQADGRLTLEVGKNRLRFAVSAGRVQAAYSPTVSPERIADLIPEDLADLAPLLTVTLGEHQDSSMSGLVKLLERGLADPRRLRTLLRAQSAILTHWALTAEPGEFTFEARASLPPMFQAFPLQISLPALAVEGIRRCSKTGLPANIDRVIFARQSPRGGNVDRVGLSPTEVRIHTLFEGIEPLEAIAQKLGIASSEVAAVALGLELAGQVERRAPSLNVSILFLEDEPDAVRLAQRVLGTEGEGFQVRHVRDRVAAQLLLRRSQFSLVMLPIDTPEHEAFYLSLREHGSAATRYIGILKIDEESQLERLDRLGLDGVLHRPITDSDLRATVRQLMIGNELVSAS